MSRPSPKPLPTEPTRNSWSSIYVGGLIALPTQVSVPSCIELHLANLQTAKLEQSVYISIPESGDEWTPEQHASIARFFLDKGIEHRDAEMLVLALKATREAVAMLSGQDWQTGVTNTFAVLRQMAPVLLAVHRDALVANEYLEEAAMVDDVLAELAGQRSAAQARRN